MARKAKTTENRLREFALSLPEAYEDFPWGERVVKVGQKIFVFLGQHPQDESSGIGVKLPISKNEALAYDCAEPSGYGLGKHGWVNIREVAAAPIPVETLCHWIEESYRAVAPKKLVAKLDAEE